MEIIEISNILFYKSGLSGDEVLAFQVMFNRI